MNLARMRAALADIEGPFPKDALLWARDHWTEAAPVLAAAVKRCATAHAMSEAEADLAFFAIHLFADRRDAAIAPHLYALARPPSRLDEILGDVTTDHLNRLLLGICGNDVAPLRAVLEDQRADPYVRNAFLLAWRWHVMSGAVDRAEAWRVLLDLRGRLDGEEDAVLRHQWAETLISLDPDAAWPLVREGFQTGWLDEAVVGLSDYEADCDLWRSDPEGQRDTFLLEEGPIGDVIAFLERWVSEAGQSDEEPFEPVVNPYRDVGRNDPCPCGSGKKFKKCCLGKEATPEPA